MALFREAGLFQEVIYALRPWAIYFEYACLSTLIGMVQKPCNYELSSITIRVPNFKFLITFF